MNTYPRILLPLDGSPLAEEIVARASDVLRRAEEVILLQAVGWPVGAARDPDVVARAYDYLREVQMRLASGGIKARVLVEVGAVVPAILEAAWREGASLVAMTTHGRTGLARWTFGSVAEKVLRSCAVPLLLVRSFEADAPANRDVRRILVPIDGSDLSCAVLPHAGEMARTLGARLVLLHVFERERPAVILRPPALPLGPAMEAALKEGVPVQQDFRQGDAAAEILKAASEHGVDLIAMTTHGHSGVARWVLGSVAEKVLRAAAVPMLVVRNAARTAAGDPEPAPADPVAAARPRSY